MTTTTGTSVAARLLELIAAGQWHEAADLHADGAFLDMNVPQWRYQIAKSSMLYALAEGYAPGVEVGSSRVFGDGEWQGFEAELHWQDGGEDRLNREVHVLRVVDGRIAEHAVYCTGVWDAETIRRQAAEAPMISP